MYLYHFAPSKQEGDTIFPLNKLKILFPDIYEKQKAKYDNQREKDVEIPGFGYWNDCINLMPVRPDLVKEELERYGHPTNWLWRFYKIDSTNLDNSKLIIMVPKDGEDTTKRDFLKFNEENCSKYCHIGDVTKYRFQKAKDNNEQPNTFAGIPHVLYKDSINTTNLEIIEF
jgi:hypothetical protein